MPDGKLKYSQLTLYYVGFAHLCLIAALVLLIVERFSFVGFFYHPRMIAVVHLVTLGWITSSILGALYMIAPMALRARLPVGKRDWWVFWVYSISVAGMVSHFWIEEIRGMLWAAHLVVLCLGFVGLRTIRALRRARIAAAVRLHFCLAFINIIIAGSFGILIGFSKIFSLLPGHVLTNVYAHAHLAAMGWVMMIIMGAGYSLLPMILPAAVPSGPRLWASALLLEAGTLGLFVTLILHSSLDRWFALLAVGGIGAFLNAVLWMKRHPRAPARTIPRPDLARLLVGIALVYLVAAVGVGLALVFLPEGQWSYRLARVYGVLALLGFFAQMILGVNLRLLPVFLWLRAAQRSPPWRSPYSLLSSWTPWLTAVAWTLGVPSLALGLYLESAAWIGTAASSLLLATLANAASVWMASVRARRSGRAMTLYPWQRRPEGNLDASQQRRTFSNVQP